MKAHLLIAVRYVRKREREGMERHGATSWLLRNSRFWRRYHFLTVMPLATHRMSGFYVRSNGLVSSKGEITRSVLSKAGVGTSFIQPPVNQDSWPRIRKAARMVARAPITATIVLRLLGRLKRSKDDVGIIIATLLLERMLLRNPDLVPIINSDLSSGQVLLACAAQGIERRSVWWQDDFHYTEAVPFRVLAGVVLNRNGLSAVRARNPNALIFKQKFTDGVTNRRAWTQMRIPARVQNVGVAVNGRFSGNKRELESLSELRQAIGVVGIELRLHPTANGFPKTLPPGISYAPKKERVEEYATRMDCVFCANSAIQFKLVLVGTPAIHVPNLDQLEFDRYGYVKKRLVFGSKNVDKTIFDRAFSFYRSAAFLEQVSAHEAEQFNIPGRPLSEIKMLLRQVGA